jgi:hypothetical protein
MDYAPQETGIYDTYYNNLMEDDCRYCHGNSLADRHHYAPDALLGNCTKCHIVGPAPDYGITVYRDCRYLGADVACHGDFRNGWHHNTYLADSDQCTACHNPQILGTLGPFQDPTLYPPTVITPSPYSCENCHWEQLVDTHNHGGVTYEHPTTDVHFDPWGEITANFTADPGVTFASNAGERALNPGDNGWRYSSDEYGNNRPAGFEKDILDNMGTHHMSWQGTVSAKCTNCHANDPGDPSWDPNDPILIRYCERCHDIKSLHRIPGHVAQAQSWGGFMLGNDTKAWEAAEITGVVDAEVYRLFTTNQRCWGCHGDSMATYSPPFSDDVPTLLPQDQGISPDTGEPGAVVELKGTNFGEDYTDGCAVELMGPGTGMIWRPVPVISWTDNEILWRLPAWVFPVGNYSVRVSAVQCTAHGPSGECTATTIATSNILAFSVTDHPTVCCISTTAPGAPSGGSYSYAPYYASVTISGSGGFGATANWQVPGNVTNISSQVILTSSEHSGSGGGPVASYVIDPAGMTWSDTSITFQINKMWKDDNGNYIRDAGEGFVTSDTVHPGEYAVRVRALYWVDKNANGVFDYPNPLDPTDPANELSQICVSDPVNLNLTNDPFVWKTTPNPVKKGARVSVIGANFGPMQEDSVVKIYKGAGGATLAATLVKGDSRFLLWSNTKIKFRTGNKPGSNIGTGIRFVQVTVGGKVTAKKQFRIIP